MQNKDLFNYLQNSGKDPASLIFEDELTGLYNRRFLHNYFQQNINWGSLEENPVSLIMMDLDRFKGINDTFGHEAGDLALIHIANILREVASEKYLSIRYAGDEFIIVLPQTDKQAALNVGEGLLRVVQNTPLRLEGGAELALALSLGIASAPVDARDHKTLIQKADTALYYAKKAGRNRLANAGDIPPQGVFVKTALYQLEGTRVAGRKSQFGAVAEALKRFSRRQTQFLLIEGAPGIGKTVFLKIIQKSVSQSKSVCHVYVPGLPQELFRPYYLMGNIVLNLLNRRDDKGESIISGLSIEERHCLSTILSPIMKESERAEPQGEKSFREGVFTTLIHLIYKLVDGKPTVILVDDLHFSDEATLLGLVRMMQRKEVPVFICGTTDTPQKSGEGEPDIMTRFLATAGREVDIQRILLSSLNRVDISQHLRAMFPGMTWPKDFPENLEQLTQGNPLFLSEIIRKLVVDGKITLSGQNWVIHPLEKGYLPKSLEEIVRQKISALDQESRQMLDHASIFGDNVSLSTLTGSCETSEARILEFLDDAASQGLLSSAFQANDENIRFLSRAVLDIAYGEIQENRRQELHERVGEYQESLYERDLLPSAATLAYHFKRSANQSKARSYEQIQANHNRAVFNAEEAATYVVGDPAEAIPKETPLDPESAALVPNVLRTLLLALRNIRLYPPESKSVAVANQLAKDAVDKILSKHDRFSIFEIDRALAINGIKVDVSEFRAFADSFLRTLEVLELKGIAFKKGLTRDELIALAEAFGKSKREEIEEGHWQGFLKEKTIDHVELIQVRYKLRVDRTDVSQERDKKYFEGLGDKERLDSNLLALLPELIRRILYAASSIKLYPLNSKATENAVDSLMKALHLAFGKCPAITMAGVGDHLFVNDNKADVSEFDLLAKTFLTLLKSVGLKSLCFLKDVSMEELRGFVGALGQLPQTGLDVRHWRRTAKEQGISNILFDQRVYETGLQIREGGSRPIHTGLGKKIGLIEGKIQGEEDGVSDESSGSLSEEMPLHMSDLLLEGNKDKINQMMNRIFRPYHGSGIKGKQEVLSRCSGLMDDLNVGLQSQMAKHLINPLLLVLSREEEPQVLTHLGTFLHRIATVLIQFVEYPSATRVLLHLQQRYHELRKSNGGQGEVLTQALVRPLKPETQQIVLEDFRSNNPSRQQKAAQLLAGLGRGTIPLLIEVVKGEGDLRIRRLATSLLAEQGIEGTKQLKKDLILQTTSEERSRILEVIDGATHDLRAELVYAIHDESQHVRSEAIRLAERINNEEVNQLLLECMESKRGDVAVKAIKCLGRIRPQMALDRILSLLKSSKEKDRLVACCQTLGQIGDPKSIDVLARILQAPGFLFLGKKHGPEVRANAALALTQMNDPRVVEILGKHTGDKNAQVSDIARSVSFRRPQDPRPTSRETPVPEHRE